MEDVRSLCPRSVVIGGGKKIYDGGTDKLFDAYQTRKRITLAFGRETDFVIPDNCELVEKTPYKVIFMTPKEGDARLIAELAREYAPIDISAEEEDIGAVVERIYAGSVSL
jgi:ABC-2 type transport system ATP-binding protein